MDVSGWLISSSMRERTEGLISDNIEGKKQNEIEHEKSASVYLPYHHPDIRLPNYGSVQLLPNSVETQRTPTIAPACTNML